MKRFILASSTYKPRFGGIENSLYYLAMTLKQNGFQPTIVCSDLGLDPKKRLPELETIDGIEVRRYRRFGRWANIIGIYPFLEFIRARAIFKELSRESEIQGVIARQPAVGLAARFGIDTAPLAYVVPGIIKTQNRKEYTNRPNGIKSHIQYVINRIAVIPVLHWMQCRLLQLADVNVVLSVNMKAQVAELCSFDLSNLIVAHPGVDSERFLPAEDKIALRDAMGWQRDGIYILVVGRIVLAKGFDLVIDAIASINTNSKLNLAIVGDGPEKAALEQRAKQNGIIDRVHFYGASSTPEKFYQASDLFIMSSFYEPFGQTILEAMASALPVIAFRPSQKDKVFTANDEIIKDKSDGLLCPFGKGELANTILEYLSAPPKQQLDMGKAGRIKMQKEYTWPLFLQTLQNALRRSHRYSMTRADL